jgi:hypothetical protein
MATLNAAVNRDRYKSLGEAYRAVEVLAGHVPDLPSRPELPDWPWCERGGAWVAACLDAAAPHADAAVVANASARQRVMLDEGGFLRPNVRPTKREMTKGRTRGHPPSGLPRRVARLVSGSKASVACVLRPAGWGEPNFLGCSWALPANCRQPAAFPTAPAI